MMRTPTLPNGKKKKRRVMIRALPSFNKPRIDVSTTSGRPMNWSPWRRWLIPATELRSAMGIWFV